jgi:UDP-glucose 4-epimerase
MRIFLTGSSGFIGSNLCLQIKDDFDLVGFDLRPPSHNWSNFIGGSLLNGELLKRIFQENRFDAVIHLAALKDASESMKMSDSYMQTNLGGTENLVEAMTLGGCERIVFASSAAVYESSVDEGIILESSRTKPANPYGLSKLKSEEFLLNSFEMGKISPTILRFFNVTGGSSTINSSLKMGDFLSVAVRAALLSKPLSVFGNNFQTADGSAIRDYINVKDVVGAVKSVIEGSQETTKRNTFNVSTGVGSSVLEIIARVEEISGKKIELKFQEARDGEIESSIGSSERLRLAFGWHPTCTLDESIQEVLKTEAARLL